MIYRDSCDNVPTHEMAQEQEVEGNTRHTQTPVGEVRTAHNCVHNCVITPDILPVVCSTGTCDVCKVLPMNLLLVSETKACDINHPEAGRKQHHQKTNLYPNQSMAIPSSYTSSPYSRLLLTLWTHRENITLIGSKYKL